MSKQYTKKEMDNLYLEKDKELDGLIDSNSEFKYSQSGKRILVDKGVERRSFKIRARKGYLEVTCVVSVDNVKKQMSYARYLMNMSDSSLRAEHKNNNPLDNRLCNLRQSTQSQNLGNRKKYSKKNLYKGYSKLKFGAIIESQKDGIRTRYNIPNCTEKEAATVYDCLAIINHGEFAETNFDKTLYSLDYIKSIIEPISMYKQIYKSNQEIQRKKVNFFGKESITNVSIIGVEFKKAILIGDVDEVIFDCVIDNERETRKIGADFLKTHLSKLSFAKILTQKHPLTNT